MLRWLRVEVRSGLASEEKMEFTSEANVLWADAGISFIVDRLYQIHHDGWDKGILMCVLDESLREIMSVYERFRVVCAAVHGICLMCCVWGLTYAGCLVCALDESYYQGFFSLTCCIGQSRSIGEFMRWAAKNTSDETDFLCAVLGGRAFCFRQSPW